MELKVSLLLLCGGLFRVCSESWGFMGPSHGLRWTQDTVHCPAESLAVIEEAFYTSPSPKVCDAKCRMGPEATDENDCYYRDGACVQRAQEEEVALLYDSCLPTSAPTRCNFSANSELPVSVNVGYSCLQGIIFDPYNKTFSWKARKITLAFRGENSPSTTVVTHCDVNADTTTPRIKITALKSPATNLQDAANVTSHIDDIILVVNDVRTNVTESRVPYWWIVREPRFKIEFRMEATGGELHPHWISLEDKHMIEVVCRKLDVSSLTMTSPKPSVIHDTLFVINGKAFTLTDVIVAVVCTIGIVLVIVLVIFLIRKYRKRHWSPERTGQRERDYSNLISRMEFHNPVADIRVSSTACSDVSDSDLQSGRPNLPQDTAGSPLRNRLPIGAAVSNDTYGVTSGSDDLQLPGKQTTSGRGAAADDSNELEEPFPFVVKLPDTRSQACGGGDGGGLGKDWEQFETEEGGPTRENTQYEEIPLSFPGSKEHLIP